MVIPVCVSNGWSTARKSFCSAAVHSAHRLTVPPMCCDDDDGLDGELDEPQAATARTTAAPTVNCLTCLIASSYRIAAPQSTPPAWAPARCPGFAISACQG